MDQYNFIPEEIRTRLKWKKDKKLESDPDQIVEITCDPYQCESCGVVLTTQRSVRLCISRNQNSLTHTKTQCQICKQYKNPVTGEFDCTFNQIHSHYSRKNNPSA